MLLGCVSLIDFPPHAYGLLAMILFSLPSPIQVLPNFVTSLFSCLLCLLFFIFRSPIISGIVLSLLTSFLALLNLLLFSVSSSFYCLFLLDLTIFISSILYSHSPSVSVNLLSLLYDIFACLGMENFWSSGFACLFSASLFSRAVYISGGYAS